MAFLFGGDLWEEMARMQQQLAALTQQVDQDQALLEGTSKCGKRCDKRGRQVSVRGKEMGVFNPCMDLAETKDSFVVSMDLPGVKKEDLTVSVHDGVLTVSGTRHHKFVAREGDDKDKEKDKDEAKPAAAAAEGDEQDKDKKQQQEQDKKMTHKIIRMESFCGSFERSVTIPVGTKSSDVQAKFVDGVLTITIAKPHKQEPKKIDIQ